MKIVIIVVVLLIAGGAGAAYFVHRQSGAFTADATTTTVRTEVVKRRDLVESVAASGLVEPKTRVQISARVAARIIELPCPMGSVVTKGDPTANPPVPPSVLIRLDSKDLEANLRSVEAKYAAEQSSIKVAESNIASQESELISTKAMLQQSKRDLKRQKELFESHDVSESAVDDAQLKVDQQQAQLEAAEHRIKAEQINLIVLQHNLDAAEAEIARAKENLTYATITSPIDGVVTKVNAEAGELVVTGTMNNAGTVILEVADLSKMIMKAKVDETIIASLKEGQKTSVKIPAYRDEAFEGTVESISLANIEDPADRSKYFKAEILLKTDGRRIYSGLNADAEIEVKRHDNVLTVPSQAVLGRPVDSLPADMRGRPEVDKDKAYATVVYRFINGKASVTPVKIGSSDISGTVIESGLNDGDVVITGPYKVLDALAHDQAVVPETASTQPATPTTKP